MREHRVQRCEVYTLGKTTVHGSGMWYSIHKQPVSFISEDNKGEFLFSYSVKRVKRN